MMKKIVAFLLFSLSFGLISAQTEMARVTRFEGTEIVGLIATSAFKVEVYQGSDNKVEIELPAELETRLECTVADGVVTLGLKKGFSLKKNQNLLAKVYVADNLRELRARGGSEIKLETPINVTSLVIDLTGASSLKGGDITVAQRASIDCSGASNVSGTISCRLFRCGLGGASSATLESTAETANWDLSGASKVSVAGSGATVNIEAGGSSAFTGREYNVTDATMRAVSAAEITIGNAESISASAGSAATINYKGSPVVKSLNTASAGKVRSY